MGLSRDVVSELMNTGLKITFDEPMSRHTSFQIGGCADALISPSSVKDITAALTVCKQLDLPYYIIGNGTNLLVSDKGVRGAVIKLRSEFSDIKVEGNKIYASAGALLSNISSTALANSLSGFEKLGGIPGTVGGAVVMNAGAYGSQISDVLVSSSYVTCDGECDTYSLDEHNFGYRESVYVNSDKIITGAVFALAHAPAEQIKAQMGEYAKRRRDKQPLTYPSAGSVFKRPEGHFAGALIEQSKLKGFCIGGACVSEKHAGFIVNTGAATASDVMRLIEYIKKTVFENSGVMLECEIKTLGEF